MSSSSIEFSSVVLHYFPIQGRAETARLLLEDAGVPYEETNDVAAFKENKENLDEYRFQQLPRLTVRVFLSPLSARGSH
jgi:hypothetical protein